MKQRRDLVTPVCERTDGKGGCAEAGPCAIVFEAGTIEELGRAVARWAGEHPDHFLVSFSHTAESRLEATPGLAGPREGRVYTGLLLTHRVRYGSVGGAGLPGRLAGEQTGSRP